MTKVSTVVAVVVLSSIVWIPTILYFMHSSVPPREKWITIQGIVLDNGTTPIFNATVVIYIDETYMEKGFTNKTGQFQVSSPYPLNLSLPVLCFVYASGYANTVQNETLPTNMTLVNSDSHNDFWGYVDFQISLQHLGGV
jgi:hypothetical protein